MATRISRHLVDPELQPIGDNYPVFALSPEVLPLVRQNIDANIVPVPDDVEVDSTEYVVPGRDGDPDVKIYLYRPRSLKGPAPLLFHIHGGGFVFGNGAMGAPNNAAWALDVGCVLVSVDYRLAPETKFPGPLNDCATALHWLADNAEKLELDMGRVAVRGDSAGGGLAAALALKMRDEKGPQIHFQLLIYPMIDDRTGSTIKPNAYSGEYIWTAADNAFAWECVLGHKPGGDGVSYLAAPARATDLTGLPPALMATAALDVFIDENLDYARRLMDAGVPTEVIVAPGAFHGFQMVAPTAAVSQRFNDFCLDALRRAFGTKG